MIESGYRKGEQALYLIYYGSRHQGAFYYDLPFNSLKPGYLATTIHNKTIFSVSQGQSAQEEEKRLIRRNYKRLRCNEVEGTLYLSPVV